jgi:hypothetical protein
MLRYGIRGPVSGQVAPEYDHDVRVTELGVNGSTLALVDYDQDGPLVSAGTSASTATT